MSEHDSGSTEQEIEIPESINNPAFGGAFRKGAEAAIEGKSRSECPYDRDNFGSQGVTFSRAFWRKWQQGYSEYEQSVDTATDGSTEGSDDV